MGHTLSDNRHGLIANAVFTRADGYAEREAAKSIIADAQQAANQDTELTLGADKGYDTAECVEALTKLAVQLHVAQSTSNRKSTVPGMGGGVERSVMVSRCLEPYMGGLGGHE